MSRLEIALDHILDGSPIQDVELLEALQTWDGQDFSQLLASPSPKRDAAVFSSVLLPRDQHCIAMDGVFELVRPDRCSKVVKAILDAEKAAVALLCKQGSAFDLHEQANPYLDSTRLFILLSNRASFSLGTSTSTKIVKECLRACIQSKTLLVAIDMKQIFCFLFKIASPTFVCNLLPIHNVLDLNLASWILDPHRAKRPLPEENMKGKSRADLRESLFHLLQVSNTIQHELKNQNLEAALYLQEIPVAQVLSEMEYRGICLRKRTLNGCIDIVQAELDQIQERIDSIAQRNINLNSPDQVAHLLFRDLRLPTHQSGYGSLSTAESVLRKIEGKNEAVSLILGFRKLAKLLSTCKPDTLSTNAQCGRHQTVLMY